MDSYFGKVVDIKDPEKRFRIRVSVPGYTHELDETKLPWYYPSVVDYLPVVGDTVIVRIFNDNFTQGFYGRKVDIEKSELADGNDYELYLEIYKRKKIQLTFIDSIGIEFINDKSSITLTPTNVTTQQNKTTIDVTDGKIELHNGGKQEPATLGETTEETLKKMIDLHDSQYKEVLAIFDKVKSVCTTPFLAPIKAVLTPQIPISKAKFPPKVSSLKSDVPKIKSKIVFTE